MQTITETLQPDASYLVRQRLGPLLTGLAQTLGQPEFHLRETEYVGTINQPLDEFTERLQANGFEWDPLAWYHRPPVGSEPDGSWTFRRGPLGDRQLHVILIAHSPEYIDVFAHDEYNWLRHPIKHFRQIGIEREAGSSVMRRWIESQGIGVDAKSRRRRRFSHAVNNFSRDLWSLLR